jgi:CRISPR/Cas system-associated protein Csx1
MELVSEILAVKAAQYAIPEADKVKSTVIYEVPEVMSLEVIDGATPLSTSCTERKDKYALLGPWEHMSVAHGDS